DGYGHRVGGAQDLLGHRSRQCLPFRAIEGRRQPALGDREGLHGNQHGDRCRSCVHGGECTDWRPEPRPEAADTVNGMPTKVAVIGAGSWGTAVAAIPCQNAPTVAWARRPELADANVTTHRSGAYLAGYDLPDALHRAA